jgi:hypothetical protein
VAANAKSLEIYKEDLSNIYIIHSTESQNKLRKETDWINQLSSNNINQEVFIERTIDITYKEDSVKKLVNYLETIIKGLTDNSKLIVDLTNGTSLQKNLLSVATYVLDIQHQYAIDIVKLSEITNERGFLASDVLSTSYVIAPQSSLIDSLAYLNLVEIIRYKKIIDYHANSYSKIDHDSSDTDFFKDNLSHSVQLKLQGDITKNNAMYRIASSAISASIEELISLLLRKILSDDKSSEIARRTLGQKLQLIQLKIEKEALPDFDIDFFRKFNDFMLYLRNSTTHKGKLLTDMEKFKADLSVKMSFPFLEFYTDIIHPILANDNSTSHPKQIRILSDSDIDSGEAIYYGIDGDNTGTILEELFISSSDESRLKKLSASVTESIKKISKFIRDSSPKNLLIIEAGDDILFKGYLNQEKLKEIQDIYKTTTSGLTCSIGYGRSFQEVYVALKFAKTHSGKNSIVGIEIS